MRLVLAVYVLGVIAVSLLPSRGVSLQNVDKAGHFLAYSGMAVLALLTFPSKPGRIAALTGAIVLGAALEWGQSFVPGRQMSLADGVANALGVFIGAVVFHFGNEPLARFVQQFFRQ